MGNSLFKPFLGIVLALIFLFWGNARAVVIERVVAVVNDEVITLTELQEEGLPLIRRFVWQEMEEGPSFERRFLEELISRRLQLQEAQKQGITVTPSEVTTALEEIKKRNRVSSDEALKEALARENLTLESFRKSLEKQLILDRLVTKEVRSKVVVTEKEVEAYYKAHEGQYMLPSEVKVRHILIKIPPKASEEEIERAKVTAEEVLSQLRAGLDFSEVARRYSQGPMADEGGELGYLKMGEMAPELEKEAFTMEEGTISRIIRTSFGFNILRIDDRRVGLKRPLEEVREAIREELFKEKAEARFKEWIKGLQERAYIEVKL